MFNLDPVGRYRLGRPPLVQALGQVRYPTRARMQTLDGIAPLQDRLTDLFPYMTEEQVQQISLLVGPAGPATSDTQTARSWRFADDDGWAAVVQANNATLSVGPQYSDFGEFEERFGRRAQALTDAYALPRCERIAVRYLDMAEMPPGEEEAWKRWFRPELIGWPASDLVDSGTRVATTLTQTHLTSPLEGGIDGTPVDIQAAIRHGLVPPNTVVPGIIPMARAESWAYLIDMDVFIQAPQPFDAEELGRQLSLLHDQVDQFFRWTLTVEGQEHFELREAE
jgi:uncharacterized protein (TIGR04255 family)